MDMLIRTIGVLMVLASPLTAWADGDLTGTWDGQFKGVQVGLATSGALGPWGTPRDVPQKLDEPNFVDAPLSVSIDTQKDGLLVGRWVAGEFGQQFACAQTSPKTWSCQDHAGRADIDIVSSNEIKVCYFDTRQGAHGAGCASMKRK